MSLLEIIHLRSAGKKLDDLFHAIKASIGGAENIRVYRRDGLETDISIHIHHNINLDGKPSSLGSRLTFTLKDFGLVEQSFWKESE